MRWSTGSSRRRATRPDVLASLPPRRPAGRREIVATWGSYWHSCFRSGLIPLPSSQLGLALGTLVSERFRQHAEQGAGLALMALGGYLIAKRAIG